MIIDQKGIDMREDKCRPRGIRFIRRIQNQQFRKLFFKNWLQVLLSILLPLFLCTIGIQYFSSRSLLREMDTSVRRSLRNTNATLETLFEEVCATLEKESFDSNITKLLQKGADSRTSYDFVALAKDVLERLAVDMRENLYYSLDAYSTASDFLASTLYRGQSMGWISDKSLLSAFEENMAYSSSGWSPGQSLLAVPRMARYVGEERWVITVYLLVAVDGEERAFVSVSVDADKLISYIVDSEALNQGAYLIVDGKGQVVLDTSHRMEGQYLTLPAECGEVCAATMETDGEKMRMSYMEMDCFGWKCVQMIPMEEYRHNTIRLRNMMAVVLLIGIAASVLLSYGATVRLFRPVEAILRLLENPSGQDGIGEENNEIQYLLFRILELFQKNIALENEMVNRLHALRRARAKALQEQMTPHFINNVLQAINWIALRETGDEDSLTSQSIILLADIIDTGKKQKYSLTTVAGEIEYTKKFLELERLRYGAGISCRYEVAPEVEGMLIPGISLQTLVENSIAHGFRAKGGRGMIYVSISVNGQQGLRIRVEDDGEGIEQEIIDDIFEQLEKDYVYVGEHLGLINLFQRFLLIYGEGCSFDIRRSGHGGACVEILTPRVSVEWLQSMGAGGEEK